MDRAMNQAWEGDIPARPRADDRAHEKAKPGT
jgi:hypothetical protein